MGNRRGDGQHVEDEECLDLDQQTIPQLGSVRLLGGGGRWVVFVGQGMFMRLAEVVFVPHLGGGAIDQLSQWVGLLRY